MLLSSSSTNYLQMSRGTYLSPLHDLEPLRDLADPSGKAGAPGDESEKKDLLFVSEGFERLPQPLYQLVVLTDAITIPVSERGAGEVDY